MQVPAFKALAPTFRSPILPSHLPQWFPDTYSLTIPSLQLLSFGLQGWGAASLPAPHLQTPAAPRRLRILSCFPTFLSTHLQRKGFLWAVTFLTHLFSWRWWWAANSKCLLSSALLLHRSERRRPMLLPRAFQTAAHKQHGEALCNTKWVLVLLNHFFMVFLPRWKHY